MPRLILASTSIYRRDLLARLGLAFDTVSPEVDEAPTPGEDADTLAARLAREKAHAVARRYPEAVVIGSDQVASLDGEIIGKPGNKVCNIEQLSKASGRTVTFSTAVAVCQWGAALERHCVVPFNVHFRPLGRAEIEAYVDREPAFDCAGGFKAEGLGISLFERLEGEDPTALIGLPLIALTTRLRDFGIDALAR